MIAKIKNGRGFKGVLNYAGYSPHKNAEIIASNGVATDSLGMMCASFVAQANANPKVRKPVGHISLSFANEDEDKLDAAFLHKIAVEYMNAMGIRNTQYVIFRHHDTPHPHIHIIYNRVDNDGKAIKGDTNFRKSTRVCRNLTEKYCLTMGVGKKSVRRERLKGRDAAKYKIYDTVTNAMDGCRSWKALISSLAEKGISTRLVCSFNGRVTGVVFSTDGVSLSGRQVDRSLSVRKIDSAMAPDERIYGRTVRVRTAAGDSPTSPNSDKTNIPDDRSSANNATINRNNAESGQAEDSGPALPDGSKDIGDTITGPLSVPNVAAAVLELVSPPQIHISAGGGGGGGKSEDDKKKKKRKNRRRNL